jgi:hypothetical protein
MRLGMDLIRMLTLYGDLVLSEIETLPNYKMNKSQKKMV